MVRVLWGGKREREGDWYKERGFRLSSRGRLASNILGHESGFHVGC